MISARPYPLFATALGACVLAAFGEGWCIFDRVRAAREAAAALERKKAELHAMADLAPSPTRTVAAAIEADLARAQRALDAMHAELQGRGPAGERLRTAKPPATPADAFFDLATFVEKTRALARAQEIELKPEAARLGFSLYANEGPEPDRIAPVFRQRLIVQYLLDSLIAAKPRALLAVQRGAPLTRKEREDRDAIVAATANGAPPPPDVTLPPAPEGPDFFTIDPRASAAVPGALDATAFRLTFVGETDALRAFLNKLAAFELPVLVREVDVVPASPEDLASEPAAASDEREAPPPSAEPSVVLTASAPAPKPAAKVAATAPGSAPIVAKPWCRFTVTVEYIELAPPAGTVADAAEAAKPAT